MLTRLLKLLVECQFTVAFFLLFFLLFVLVIVFIVLLVGKILGKVGETLVDQILCEHVHQIRMALNVVVTALALVVHRRLGTAQHQVLNLVGVLERSLDIAGPTVTLVEKVSQSGNALTDLDELVGDVCHKTHVAAVNTARESGFGEILLDHLADAGGQPTLAHQREHQSLVLTIEDGHQDVLNDDVQEVVPVIGEEKIEACAQNAKLEKEIVDAGVLATVETTEELEHFEPMCAHRCDFAVGQQNLGHVLGGLDQLHELVEVADHDTQEGGKLLDCARRIVILVRFAFQHLDRNRETVHECRSRGGRIRVQNVGEQLAHHLLALQLFDQR
mmetsp:Transcript_30099/g.75789  ORF Transcript_30099/g.75789 Transcript_30099/m.75789 type:complete len:331 (-) Transcript_30099:774-1766(-)